MENKDKEVTGFDYLWCALYASAAFAIELLLLAIEGKIGFNTQNLTTAQHIGHWILITILWIIAGVIIILIGRKTTGHELWKPSKKMKGWQYLALAACFLVNIVSKYFEWNGFKVVMEWNSRGPLLFVFQYIYYLAEGFLVSLVIVYGQLACEKWFRNDKIPYGGIVLGLTWGLMHIVSKGDVWIGLLSAFAGFLFGAAYVIVNKDYRKALPVITLLFIL